MLPLALLLLGTTARATGLPVSGTSVPALAAFDDAMVDFMETNGIEAGLLGVMKDGAVVLERGYGWEDPDHGEELPPDAMMRIASVTKPLTAAAIRELVAAGTISLSDYVFDLGQPAGGLLDITPFLALGDMRLEDITVQHCLDHEAGWDRDIAEDLTYKEIEIANDMRIPSPPGRENTASWILGQPLEHDPGTTYAYSNIGYMMLGLIVEEYGATDYMDFVHEEIFGSFDVDLGDIELGRTFAEDQNPREPWYEYAGSCTNVYDTSEAVNCPYGGWDHEARVSQGRVISATIPLLHFLENFYISGASIGAPRSGTEGSTWKRDHTGSLSGTNALARQRGDGVNYVVLFNERPSSGTSYASQIRTILDEVIDSEISEWPDPACGDGVLDAAEECDDGNTANGDCCNADCTLPVYSCADPGRSIFILKDRLNPRSDRLTWKWLKGTAALEDFGDPTDSTGFNLCLLDDDKLVYHGAVTPGGDCSGKPCWRSVRRGYKYKNLATNDYGYRDLAMLTGSGNAKVLLRKRGINLNLPGSTDGARYFEQDERVTVRLVRDDGAACWEASFLDYRTNDADEFRAIYKAP
jgi:cysteine-rich repeat protein